MATIAPWLIPPNFLGAISSGAQAGLQLAQQRAQQEQFYQKMALEQQQQAAAEAQAAERLRLANEEMFQRAQQESTVNALKQAEFAQEQHRFQLAQERQARLDEANRAFGASIGEGLSGEKPDILGAFSRAAVAAPEAAAVQKLDADALIRAQNASDINRQTQGYLTNVSKMGFDFNEPILTNPANRGTPEWDAAIVRASAKQAQRIQNLQRTAAMKEAEAYGQQLTTEGATPEQVQTEKNRFIATKGAGAKAPEKEVQFLNAADSLANGLQNVLNDVSAFNAKFGPNAFDQFTGSLDNRIFSFKKRFGTEFTKEDELAARAIFQELDQVATDYRTAKFGTALTGSETKQFEKVIDRPDSATFLPSIQGAIETTKKQINNKLGNYPHAQNITPEFRSKYVTPVKSAEASKSPVRITSKAQYDALKSGDPFIDDSGHVKIKK